MTSQVTLPLWLALLIGALAIWAAFERIVVPAVRSLMRRRLNRAIDELNTKLKLRIQPLKLAKRQALIDQLIFDPEVLRAIEAYAAENKVSREAAQARARDYAKEIVPSFSAYAYFGIGIRMARWLSTFLYRVRLGYLDEQAMQTVDPDAAVIFVINHRSNMDYVLVTYMASTSSALSYAVGEWARVGCCRTSSGRWAAISSAAIRGSRSIEKCSHATFISRSPAGLRRPCSRKAG